MSNAERQKRYRERNAQSVTREHRNAPESVTPGPTVTRTASLDDYNASRQDYTNRTKPEMLNWGPWMSADDLARAKLSANRVPIPGDWDYEGVAQATGVTP